MFKNNLKITIAVLKRKKLFSAITILGITIPLMFLMIVISIISHVAAYEPPQSNFDRVMFLRWIKNSTERENGSGNFTGNPTYDFVKNYIKPMKTPEKVGVIAGWNLYNYYKNNQKTKLNVAYTDAGFWDIADFRFNQGKAFNTTDVENIQPFAVIDEFTRNLVFGDSEAIGKSIRIFRIDYKVIGVVKNVDRIRTETYANVYLPITTSIAYSLNDIVGAGVTCMILAKSKEQFTQIESEFNHLIKNFDLSAYEGLKKIDGELEVKSFNSDLQNLLGALFSIRISKTRTIYLAYGIIFFFFILLPAINLLYIHISRINERSSEIGVRKSFGGNKQALARQFLFENLFLTVFSGVLALIFTLLFCFVLNSSNVIQGLHLKLNATSLLLVILLWIIFGIITGVFPAIRMSRMKIIDALHQHDSHQFFDFVIWKAKRLKLLLVVEFIITFIGLAAIGIFVFKFQKNNGVPVGFNVKDVYHVWVGEYDGDSHYFQGNNTNSKITDILEQVETNPFVQLYGKWTYNEPYHDGYTTFNGRETIGDVSVEEIHITKADENMDKILGLNTIEGRWFNKSDDRPDYYPIVINRLLKEKLFKNERAIGEQVEILNNKFTIIGVIDNYKYHGEFSEPTYMMFFRNQFKNMSYNSWGRKKTDFFKVKPGVTSAQVNELATNLSQKYPDYEIEITPLKTDKSKYYMKIWGPIMAVIIVFAFVLLIVLLGLFGVLWYNVSLRKTEIGLRRAVGANQNKVFTMVIKEMLSWANIGIAIGIVLMIQIPLLKLFPIEPGVFVASIISAALIIYLLIILCSLIPGIQATKIQPATALHEE